MTDRRPDPLDAPACQHGELGGEVAIIGPLDKPLTPAQLDAHRILRRWIDMTPDPGRTP